MYYGSLRHKRQYKQWKARVGTCEQEKRRWLHPKIGIRVPYFRSRF